MKLLEQWYAYFDFCIGNPLDAPVCRPFWTWVMIAFLAVGTLIVIWVGWKILGYQLKLRAARRAQMLRDAIADEDTMEQHRWTGDRVHGEDDRNAEVRIRSAIAARRSRNMGPTV